MKNIIPLKKKLRIYIGDIVDAGKAFLPRTDNGFRVLLYHSITDKSVDNEWEENTTPKELFNRQMKYLADEKYNIISCKKAIRYVKERRKVSARTIVITFDDGYKNFYTNALPILKQHNFCTTLFLGVNLLRDYSADAQYLSREEIMDIKKSGLIGFGCHSLTHRALSMIDEKELDEEITIAKQKLEYLTQSEIDLFAYPFGHSKSYNKNAIDKIKSAGFSGSFTTISGLNDFKKDCFLLRRNRISWIDELDEFEKHLNGSYDWCALCEHFRHKRYNFKDANMQKEQKISKALSRVDRRYKVETAAFVNNQDLIDFFKVAYSGEFNAADYQDGKELIRRLEWSNLKNPNIHDKQFPAWVCKDNKTNKIVGHFGIMPVLLKFKNSYYPVAWGRDLVALPELRRLGIGPFLVDSVLKDTKDKVVLFLVAGLSDAVYSVFKKIGFIDLGFIPLYVRINRLDNVLQRKIGNKILARLLGVLGGGFLKIIYAPSFIRRCKYNDSKETVVTEIINFDDSFDKLWEQTSAHFPIVIKRDSISLNWRFVHQPYWEYKIFKAVDKKDGELKGYVVLRAGKSQGLRVGVVSDFFARPDDFKTLAVLINFITRYFEKKSNIDLIRCDILHKRFERILREFGFINMRSKSHFMVGNINQSNIDLGFLGNRDNWFINYADCDLDLSGRR